MSSNKINLSLMLILGLLMAFTSLSTDIYLPAMPQMEVDLQGNVELTITGFLIGFTIAQLVWGAISDRIGRKIPLYFQDPFTNSLKKVVCSKWSAKMGKTYTEFSCEFKEVP